LKYFNLNQIWSFKCQNCDNKGEWFEDYFYPNDCYYINYNKIEIKNCLNKKNSSNWYLFSGDSLTRNYFYSFFFKKTVIYQLLIKKVKYIGK